MGKKKKKKRTRTPRGEDAVLLAEDLLAAQPDVGDVLFVTPPPGLPGRLSTSTRATNRYLYLDYATYRGDGASVGNGAAPALHLGLESVREAARDVERVVVFLPKAKQLAAAVFSAIAVAVPEGTPVVVVGPKRSGIESIEPLVEERVGTVVDKSAAHHARAVVAHSEARRARRLPESAYEIEVWEQRVRVVSLPGVFSEGRLDDGTALLLQALTPPEEGARVLDWGSGSGVIGAAIQLAVPGASVDLVDVDTMAVAATKRTLRANELGIDCAWLSDGWSDVDGEYDLIVSNLPFHAGHEVDLDASRRFLDEAPSHLRASGRLVVVANRFLDYFEVLRAHFGEVEVVEDDARYRIIEAVL